jgi:hypothetical protein
MNVPCTYGDKYDGYAAAELSYYKNASIEHRTEIFMLVAGITSTCVISPGLEYKVHG